LGETQFSNVQSFVESIKSLPAQQVKNILSFMATSAKHQIELANIIIEAFQKAVHNKNHGDINEIITGLLLFPESLDILFLYFPVTEFLKLLVEFSETKAPGARKVALSISLGSAFLIAIFIVEHFKLSHKLPSLFQSLDGFFCGWIYSSSEEYSLNPKLKLSEFNQKFLSTSGVESILTKVASPQEKCFLVHRTLLNIFKSGGLSESLPAVISSLISLLSGSLSFTVIASLKKLKLNVEQNLTFSSHFSSLILALAQHSGFFGVDL